MPDKKSLKAQIDAISPEKVLFVLDIDSTLVTTYQRNQAILKEYCKKQQDLFPEDCQMLQKAQCRLGDYGYKTSIQRIGGQPLNSTFLEELEIFWREHFFSNHFLHNDMVTEGALEFVNLLVKKNIPFVYLTGRHKKTMWEGTIASLRNLGFPLNPEELILKEDSSQKDELYKSQAIGNLKEKYKDHTLWLIDNEPVILNQIEKDHNDVQLIWFESCHSGKMSPPDSALKINHFLFSR